MRRSTSAGPSEQEKPTVLQLQADDRPESLLDLLSRHPVRRFVDAYHQMLEDLFNARHPDAKGAQDIDARFDDFLRSEVGSTELQWWMGAWIYYPWDEVLVRSLPNDGHHELRTARNRGLFDDKAMESYRQLVVGVMGQSVGASIAMTITLEGGADSMKIGDFDVLSASNLNRIRASIADIGLNKTVLTARQIYALNPFAQLTLFKSGLNEGNLEDFLTDTPKLDVVVEEVDDMPAKIRVRLFARKHRIPVVMATNLDRTIVLDVERFDTEPERPIFHGRIGDNPERLLEHELSPNERFDLMYAIAGKEIMPDSILRMESALKERRLDRPSQLGGTVSACGAIVSDVLRDLASGQDVPSGRRTFDFDTGQADIGQ